MQSELDEHFLGQVVTVHDCLGQLSNGTWIALLRQAEYAVLLMVRLSLHSASFRTTADLEGAAYSVPGKKRNASVSSVVEHDLPDIIARAKQHDSHAACLLLEIENRSVRRAIKLALVAAMHGCEIMFIGSTSDEAAANAAARAYSDWALSKSLHQHVSMLDMPGIAAISQVLHFESVQIDSMHLGGLHQGRWFQVSVSPRLGLTLRSKLAPWTVWFPRSTELARLQEGCEGPMQFMSFRKCLWIAAAQAVRLRKTEHFQESSDHGSKHRQSLSRVLGGTQLHTPLRDERVALARIPRHLWLEPNDVHGHMPLVDSYVASLLNSCIELP